MITSWRDIPGWFDFQDIYDQAVDEASDGEMLVEVGSFCGRSAAYMAERIRESHKWLHFWCVDTWDDAQYKTWWIDCRQDPPSPWPVEELYGMPLCNAFYHCIEQAGVRKLIQPVRLPSVDVAGALADQSLSFVFIDANHLYPGISADIKAWKPKVKSGGLLGGHDYRVKEWPDVARAVDEAFTEVEHRGTSWIKRL